MQLKKNIKNKLEVILEDCYNGYELQLEKLCKKLNLNCFEATFHDSRISGSIYKDTNKANCFNIYINRDHSITRKRFTTAHEIGHFISAKFGSYSEAQLSDKGFEDYAISFRQDGEGSLTETAANLIAAEMLMPELWVKQFLAEGMSIEMMADTFFVSQAAMTIRLERLGVEYL